MFSILILTTQSVKIIKKKNVYGMLDLNSGPLTCDVNKLPVGQLEGFGVLKEFFNFYFYKKAVIAKSRRVTFFQTKQIVCFSTN